MILIIPIRIFALMVVLLNEFEDGNNVSLKFRLRNFRLLYNSQKRSERKRLVATMKGHRHHNSRFKMTVDLMTSSLSHKNKPILQKNLHNMLRRKRTHLSSSNGYFNFVDNWP